MRKIGINKKCCFCNGKGIVKFPVRELEMYETPCPVCFYSPIEALKRKWEIELCLFYQNKLKNQNSFDFSIKQGNVKLGFQR